MATLLGSAGLAPFIAFAGATWVDPAVLGEAFAGKLLGPAQGVTGLIQHMLSVYAVAVLAFLGAIHWGLALAGSRDGASSPSRALLWSVLPAIYGWIVVSLIDLPRAFWWLAAGFALAWVTDRISYPRHEPVPGWFVRLRTTLTIVVVASLVAAAIAP
jgi:hypothetical protein